MTYLDEAQAELVTMDYFRDLGYAYVHGPEIAPDREAPERQDYGQVVLVDRLRAARSNYPKPMPSWRASNEQE